ncbi:MAG: carboxypeptidase regulatory-like domain-containing protein, partial [Planctomycetota bacterium]|nr:carboxypeptidase regulatory-like domain-containing protein [Planctomycetota bacterium]
MKRTLPLLLLLAALTTVALFLTQPSDKAEIEEAVAIGVTPSQTEEKPVTKKPLEDTLVPEAGSEREAAPSIGGMSPAGEIQESGRTLKGQLVTPVGSPRDPSLRVVAVSLEGTLEEAYVEELVGLQERDPELAKQRALALKLRNDGPYQGRPYSIAELNPDGSFSFEISESSDLFYFVVEGRYLYLEDPMLSAQEIESDRTYRIEPIVGACLTIDITPPPAASAQELVESLPRVSIKLGGSDSSGMMSRFQREKTVEMEFVGDTRYEARALPTKFFWTGELATPDYLNTRTNALKLKPGEEAQLELRLDMGGRISGVVKTEGGEPLEGASLSARPTNDTRFWMGGGEVQKVESDAEGNFELRGVQTGEIRLSATLDGHLPPEPLTLELNEAEMRTGLEIVMSDGLSIKGVVLWPDGTPTQGASVGLETGEESGNRWNRGGNQLWVETDEKGGFLLTGLKQNNYRVRANHDPKDDSELSGRWRGLAAGIEAGTSGVVIKLEEPAVVNGKLVMSSGAELPQDVHILVELALVTVSERDAAVKSKHGALYQSARISRDGSFQITGIYPAEYEVNFNSGSFVHTDASQRYVYPSGELIVSISRGGIISGILLDPLGSPVSGSEITASTGESSGRPNWGGGSRGDSYKANSGEDGSFTVEGLKPGSYKLVADSDDWGPNPEELVRIEEGQIVEGITLQLIQGGTIIGVVYGEDGSAAAGRTISAGQGGFMGMGGGSGGEATTDASGRFIVERLAEGTYQVSTQPTMEEIEEVMQESGGGGGGNWTSMMSLIETVSVDVVDGETVEVVLGAPPVAPVLVFGRVLEGDQPVTSGTVLAVADGQGFMQGSSTAN